MEHRDLDLTNIEYRRIIIWMYIQFNQKEEDV